MIAVKKGNVSIVWAVLLVACALMWRPAPAFGECTSMSYTDVDPNEARSRLTLIVDDDRTVGRQFTVDGETVVAAVRLRLERSTDATDGYVRVEYHRDDNGEPSDVIYHVSYAFPASTIGRSPAWYEFTGMATTLEAGTYWLTVRVEQGSARLGWVCRYDDVCQGDVAVYKDSEAYWQLQDAEALYQVVCSDCPTLNDPSVSPPTPSNNSARIYTYEVTYRNYANNAPSKYQVKTDDGAWHDMTRVDSDPYSSGTRYRYTTGSVRIGVGQHTYTFHFETASGSKAELVCNGPTVGSGPPSVSSASFSPALAKTNQDVQFSCTASDTDGGSVNEYRWRLAKQGASDEYKFTRTYSPTSVSAGTIGIGTWDVYVTVLDDEGLASTEYKCAQALAIIDQASPTITGVSASVDGHGTPSDGIVGVFIPDVGVAVYNKFTATATDPENDISKVKFVMPHRLGTATIEDNAPPYEATFDMDNLPDEGGVLKVIAIDSQGHTSAAWEVTIVTADRPSWWGKNWVYNQQAQWDEGQLRYTLKCWVPNNPRLNYDYDIDTGDLFGTLENHFESDIAVEEHFYIDGSPVWWDYSAQGVLDVTILSQQLLDQQYPGTVHQLYGPPYPVYRRMLDYYRMTSPQANLLEFSVEGPSWDTRGVIWVGPVPVEYHIGLDTELGFELNMSVGADLNADLSVRSLRITPTPQFSVEFDLYAEVYEGLARAGVRFTPTVSLDLPLVYQFGQPGSMYLDTPCFQFWVDCVIYGSILWGVASADLYSFTYPDPPYDYPDGCGDDGSPARHATGEKTLFAAPTIAADKKAVGSVCVWVHDEDPDPGVTNPELYYSYTPDPGGGWSSPARVFPADNQRWETDPKVIYTAANTAVLVWTQNELTKAEAEAPEMQYHKALKSQELYYSTWTYNPATRLGFWTPARKLTNDAEPNLFGDGLVALGADGNSGNAIAVWVRETTQNPVRWPNPRDWEIYYSNWNGVVWSQPAGLTADAIEDLQPDVAMDANGNIMVVWTRDLDNEILTNVDRSIAYRTYNANQQAWGPLTLLTNTVPGCPPGGMSPAVTYDVTNTPIVLFTSRGNNSRGHPLHDGPTDRLYAACFGGAGPRVGPVGSVPPRAMEAKARCNSKNDLTAVWRGFEGAGSEGFDGEIAINAREGGAGSCDYWGGARFLTDDNVTDWQVDFDIDTSDTIQIVHVKKGVGGMAFGDGYDGIFLQEIPAGPDVQTTDGAISFSNDVPSAGEEVTVTARVYNRGSERVFGPLTVQFSVDGAPFATQSVGYIPYHSYVDVSQIWVSDGLIHTIGVFADSTNVIAEANEGNNIGSKEIGRLHPPTNLQAGVDAQTVSIVLSWTGSAGAHHYNVLRSETSGTGYIQIGETSDTVYADSTAANNKPYYYIITASDSAGANESEPSNEASGDLGPDTDGDGTPDVSDTDDDNDGMSDACENQYGFDPLDPSDGDEDADGDFFTNAQECQAGTNPLDISSWPDIQLPPAPLVATDLYSTSLNELFATWTCEDENSGVAYYNYAIGTFPGGTDVRPWTYNGNSNTLTATGLSLVNGKTYFISVRATDNAGNTSDVGISQGTTVDTTAPVITAGPTVSAYTPENRIAAEWSSRDSESKVEKLEYSVGTSAGATDVVPWTDAGLGLGMNHTGLSLSNGRLYYVNVRVTNGAGLQSTASSTATRAVHMASRIPEALDLPQSIWIGLANKPVTARFPGEAFVEEEDRSAGMLITGPVASLAVGDRVSVFGQMATTYSDRAVVAETIERLAVGQPTPKPLGMSNRGVQCGARNVYTPGATGGVGPNVFGLLVRLWGKVTYVGNGYFYVDDGSGLFDGLQGSVRGVRVRTGSVAAPSLGDRVAITGIIRAGEVSATKVVPFLWPRTASDLQKQ